MNIEMPIILEDYLNYMEMIRGKSPNTIQAYQYDLVVFLRYMRIRFREVREEKQKFEEIEIQDIDENFIKRIKLNDLYAFLSFVAKKRGNSQYARARKVACLKSFFKYLTNKVKLIEENPTLELEAPKTYFRHPVYLKLQDAQNLIESIEGIHKERDQAIITLFLNCGLRLSELANIKLEDIQGDTLRVIGKGNKERTVYLNKACLRAIERYLQIRPTEGIKDEKILFLSQQKKGISKRTIQHLVKMHLKKAGLNDEKLSVHKLRHTAATLMYQYGHVDIRALQQILGHENISTTQIYTHIDDEQLRQASQKNPLASLGEEAENYHKEEV